MDVLYVCRAGRNEELRYALRSLANLPHDRVWIAGGWPEWVQGCETVPVKRVSSKYHSSTANLRAALEAGVSDEFVFMNDDLFLMEPIAEVPVLHLGPIEQVASKHQTHSYSRKMRLLADWLKSQGHPEPLCYEVHAPMVMSRTGMLEVLDLPAPAEAVMTHKRTLYGNHFEVGGTQTRDFKAGRMSDEWAKGRPFLSTSDHVFAKGDIGRYIRETFPEPGPYEVKSASRPSERRHRELPVTAGRAVRDRRSR